MPAPLLKYPLGAIQSIASLQQVLNPVGRLGIWKKVGSITYEVPSLRSDSLSYHSGDSFLRYHACCLCLRPFYSTILPYPYL